MKQRVYINVDKFIQYIKEENHSKPKFRKHLMLLLYNMVKHLFFGRDSHKSSMATS